LVRQGFKLRLNIVGFALADQATKEEMARIARITGGKFYDVNSAKELSQAIQDSLAVSYDVMDAAGARVGGGFTGRGEIELPEGVYQVVVRAAVPPITASEVRIAAHRPTKVRLKKEGQEVGVQVLGP
jgi:hypothetical protein